MIHKLKFCAGLGVLSGIWANIYILKDNNKM